MEESSVVFKGTVNGLTIIMKEDETIENILVHIERKIASAGKFFKGATLAVKYRGRRLTKEEETKVFDLLSSKSGASIKSLERDAEEPVKVQPDAASQSPKKLEIKKFFFFKGLEEGMTRFYRGTVRSGQLVSYEGNLVVVGDVNPGGEIVAAGNVIVMGSLRGMVHAGSDGNKEAVVVALNLQPMQLRIADVITRPPDDKEAKNQFIPEIAYVKEDTVYIERYLPQR